MNNNFQIALWVISNSRLADGHNYVIILLPTISCCSPPNFLLQVFQCNLHNMFVTDTYLSTLHSTLTLYIERDCSLCRNVLFKHIISSIVKPLFWTIIRFCLYVYQNLRPQWNFSRLCHTFICALCCGSRRTK